MTPRKPALAEILDKARDQIRAGRRDEAAADMARASDAQPGDAALAFELGALLHDMGRPEEAVAAYRRALAADPLHGSAMVNLGILLGERGALAEAEAVLSPALTRPAGAKPALTALLSLREARGADAEDVLRALTVADPRDSDAWTALGSALRTRNPAEALKCFGAALAADPYRSALHGNLGVGLMNLGRVVDAVTAFETALALDPDNLDASHGLGLALLAANTSQDPGLTAQSVALLRKVADALPHSIPALTALSGAYKAAGLIAEARECCRRAAQVSGSPAFALREVLLAPRVYASAEAMEAQRQGLLTRLDELGRAKAVIPDPLATVGETCFSLAYHAKNDADIQRKLAEFYLAAVPGLDFVAPHCRRPPAPPAGRKIRLGIVGSYLHNRTLDNLNVGLIGRLSRQRFEIVFFRPGGVADSSSDAMDRLADTVIYLPNDLAGARDAIAAETLDALFYFEIGMVALCCYLAYARLAPVQCVTWGHPDTTGAPNMDYFLSSGLLEPEDGDGHYTERLIRLEHLPTCYPKPPVEEVAADRDRLGLPAGAHLYVCPQNLMKIHPDFDEALRRILTEDPDGWLFITVSAMEAWRPALQERLARHCGEAAKRIVFLPQMSRVDFMNLLLAADVNLDPFHFSGGNSTHEALALGSPVVTLPGAYMRGRVSLGLYRRMGYMELVAKDLDDYVAKALRLARDPQWRESVRATIREKSEILFDNVAMVREFESFIEAAVDAASTGGWVSQWPRR